MSPTSPEEQALSEIKNEMDELERHIQHAMALGDDTFDELRAISERLAKLEEQVAALKRSLLLRDLGA